MRSFGLCSGIGIAITIESDFDGWRASPCYPGYLLNGHAVSSHVSASLSTDPGWPGHSLLPGMMDFPRRDFKKPDSERNFKLGYGFDGQVHIASQDAADLLRAESDKVRKLFLHHLPGFQRHQDALGDGG